MSGRTNLLTENELFALNTYIDTTVTFNELAQLAYNSKHGGVNLPHVETVYEAIKNLRDNPNNRFVLEKVQNSHLHISRLLENNKEKQFLTAEQASAYKEALKHLDPMKDFGKRPREQEVLGR